VEARQQYEAAARILREVGGGSGPLLRAWRTAQASATRPADRDTTKTEPVAAEPIAARVAMTSSSAQPAPPPRASIVVLPFANLSNDPQQQYFADGITGNLTTDLSRIPDMLVISRNTAFTYRNKPVDTKQIGRELGVRYVLEGEVQRSASRVRVTAQLIDAETDVHLWAERFDGDAGDLLLASLVVTRRTRCVRHSSRQRSKMARSSRMCRRRPGIATRAPPSCMTGADTIQKRRLHFSRPTNYETLSA
jgi:TolB-like protein